MPSHNGADTPFSLYRQLPTTTPIPTIVSDNRRDERLSHLVVTSLARQMSKPEHHLSALSWRRLHLARAKLKASSRTSALLSGFAMVAMVEMNVNTGPGGHPVPTALLVSFTVCTTLLVSVHMLALMISTCILPNVEAVASIHGLAAVNESPHEKMHFYIEIAWAFSTVFGIFLFLIELAILCWVKFWDVGGEERSGHTAALAATIILIPIGIIFIAFTIHFYRTLVSHKFERSERGLQELETMISELHNSNEQQFSPTSPFDQQFSTPGSIRCANPVLNI